MAEPLVRVYDLTEDSAANRLSIVSELCPAAETIPDGYAPYLPDAVAMRGEWRAPTAEELSELLGTPGVRNQADVLIVKLPHISHVLRNHFGNLENYEFLKRAVRDVNFVRVLEQCVDELVPFCMRPDGVACQGAWANPPGMRMLTHNMKLTPPLRIGFHVDNLDDLPLVERAHGRRRLCANLGLRPRYLLFLRTPLSALAAAGKVPLQAPDNMSPAALVRAYLGTNLKQLAVRLRIDPDEAYIVNAEDVIHDAASSPGEVPDLALHYLGHFGVTDSLYSSTS
jgi:hypothetical protein